MHKKFYASGFIYLSSTQQILLQQHKPSAPLWSLFGGKSQNKETPINTFRRVTYRQSKIKITSNSVNSVYDYFNTELNSHCYVFYAQIDRERKEIPVRKGHTVKWFTFKQIHKLPVNEKTRQDITVAKRVIDAIVRNKESQNNI